MSEPAWMMDWLRDLIEYRRKIFKTDGSRSVRWRVLKRRIERTVEKRKKKHNEFIIEKFKGSSDPSAFYRMVNCLIGKNEKPRWSPSDMYPDLSDREAAERLAEYFNSISNEFQPLDMIQVNVISDKEIRPIDNEEIVEMFKKAK